MTLAELEAAGLRAAKIRSALEQLEKAQCDLNMLNANRPDVTNTSVWVEGWNCDIALRKRRDSYDHNVPHVTIRIPFAVVQQQLVDRVAQIQRSIIALGGTVPTRKTKP